MSSAPSQPDPLPSSAKLITVLCVDDCPRLVDALCMLIGREKDMTVVGELNDVADFLRVAAEIKPHVAIVDLTMPGKLEPIDAIRTIADTVPDMRVLVYSGHDDPDTVDKVMEAGAWGLVSKFAEPSSLIQAVRRVATGDVVF